MPALLRRTLYPDAFGFGDLRARGIRAQHDLTLPPERVETPLAPELGIWPEAHFAATPRYELPPVHAARLRGAYYAPWFNLITDRRGAVLRDSASTVLPIDHRALSKRLPRRPLELPGHCALFRSVHNSFYHTLIDNLARASLLRAPCYRALAEIKLLVPGPPTAHEQFLFDRCLPGNLVVTQVPDDRQILPEILIFASFPTRRSVSCLPTACRSDMLRHLLPGRPRRPRHRILIERRPGPRKCARVIENHGALADALAPFGFISYRLEELGFEEQIALFYDAEAVVAAHGAGLANLVFSRNVDVLELHPSRMVMPHFYFLSTCMGHRYHYWKGSQRHFDDSFAVDVDGVLQRLPARLRRPARRGACG
ncbi:MAG: glycosyltransferase family 61 protein [Chromatiales bacterium]